MSQYYLKLVLSYAEQHAKLENDFSKPAPTISVFDSVLPILQKLLENNVKIKISDKPLDTITTFRVIIDSEYPSYINIKQHYEHLAIEEIVKLLTEKSNKGKIIIYKLIDRILEIEDILNRFNDKTSRTKIKKIINKNLEKYENQKRVCK